MVTYIGIFLIRDVNLDVLAELLTTSQSFRHEAVALLVERPEVSLLHPPVGVVLN